VGDILYGAATLGLKMESTMYWLMLKNFSYTANIGLTLSTNFSVTALMFPPSSKFMKDWIGAELAELDVADFRGKLPEKLRWIRADDRKQILKALATGERITPKKQVWSAPEKDRRYTHQGDQEAYDVAEVDGSQGDGHKGTESLGDILPEIADRRTSQNPQDGLRL
jgi:hypothetical protein